MTLSLNEVRDVRFPMARRANEGYRAGEVDDFVDKVYATMTTLTDENERLKSQMSALNEDSRVAQNSAASDELRAENERLKSELEAARAESQTRVSVTQPDQGQLSQAREELDRLRRENAELQQREQQLRSELDTARTQQAQSLAGSGKVEHITVSTSDQASPVVIRLVQLATEQAENLVSEAEAEAARKRADAEREADQTTSAARAEAERINNEARENSERMAREAQQRADQVDVDARNRRGELFTELERERDEFQGKVDQLRSYESDYRQRIIGHLRQQAEAIEKHDMQPGEAPSLLGDERGKSATPRLDALLANKH
ncbi:DivIVA domain-containing protein [Aestuariimicrobium sp. p3-SID1156]|uniref:DivIVA domain-containing protein n=1 Tax=Aestuariimicrobium sp. p3-SID1156 TaxID=2916038 RepID=UPI00223BD57B|nr:DivIVA domain-containing protein [Aestuariimicrobium sp. p3-SID1156]MCT1458915.1 DivIVA domain-containing protein [Aestuariimicrobium sp. p3-SID1156]